MVPSTLSVLIVDDDAEMREMLRQQLAVEFTVREADSGEAAIRSADEQPPDVILVDLGMPRMNGVEVIRRIKSGPVGVRTAVVVLTGDTRPTHLHVAAAAGADAILSKPVDLDLLAEHIRSAAAGLVSRK
ncbi:MAG: response regulator [Acidobacteria bacterium]|nr:response regulator [Acidobacteriota bacterium]